jgi:D-alanyl-D-alanine carboxypeptidase (penicillin-binding protein 5/6)
MRLIAVVLGVPNSQTRFDEARAMMDYGFSSYSLTPVARAGDWIGRQVPGKLGSKDQVEVAVEDGLTLLLRSGMKDQLSFEAELPESIAAPVRAGDPLGTVWVLLSGKRIAQLPAVAAQDVRLPGMLEGFVRLFENWR